MAVKDSKPGKTKRKPAERDKLRKLHKPDKMKERIRARDIRYRIFVQNFVDNGGHVTNAALAAGYAPKSAYSQGSDLLKLPEIQARIEAAQRVKQRHLEYHAAVKGITKERWLQKLAAIAFANQNDFTKVTDHGGVKLVPTSARPDEMGHAIRKVSQSTSMNGGSESLELHDPMRALELLGKHFGWVRETVEHLKNPEVKPAQLKNLSLEELRTFNQLLDKAAVDLDAPIELPAVSEGTESDTAGGIEGDDAPDAAE